MASLSRGRWWTRGAQPYAPSHTGRPPPGALKPRRPSGVNRHRGQRTRPLAPLRGYVVPVNNAGLDESESVERLGVLERRLELLKYPIVAGGEVLEPVGVIADFTTDITDPVMAQRASRDFLRIPHRSNREGYCGDYHAAYWLSGLADYDKVVAALHRTSVKADRVFDFGGSTGTRVFRHFFCQSRTFEIWTSDFKQANFVWNQRHMPPELGVFLSGFYPAHSDPGQTFRSHNCLLRLYAHR